MNTQEKREEREDLAGEYVLGTLQGEARDAFERQLASDAQLRAEVVAWEARLAPMLDAVEPVSPPPRVWKEIEQRINPAREEPRSTFWDNLFFWRSVGMVAASLVVVLAITLLGVSPDKVGVEGMMVVLNEQSKAGWVISSGKQPGALQVHAIDPTPMPTGKVCQLWVEVNGGDMRSVGILPDEGWERLELPAKVKDRSRYKVTIEPQGGAPGGRPSGEIVFEGAFTRI